MTRLRRWGGALLLLLLGVVVGLAGAFVQAQRVVVDSPWGPVTVPWGVPVVWIALVLAVRGGVWAGRARWGGWVVAAGWLVATLLFSVDSPSGDIALSGGFRQTVYLLGGVILAAVAASVGLAEPGAASARPTGRVLRTIAFRRRDRR